MQVSLPTKIGKTQNVYDYVLLMYICTSISASVFSDILPLMIDNPSFLFVVIIKFVVKAILDLPEGIELCPGLLVFG